MAPRQAPTIRQRRLGTELRRLREALGMSSSRAAGLLGVDRVTISNIEAGRFGISAERLHRLISIYECGAYELAEALAGMRGGRRKGWWEEYRGKIPPDFLDVSEAEHDAVSLRTVQTAVLPGLFQTEEHARSHFDLLVPPLPRLEVELRVAHRLARRSVLTGDRTVPYTGFVHEAALRMQPGGRQVARAQLRFLLEESERARVTLRVIPFSAGGFPLLGDSVMYAGAAHPVLDTVHMDSPTGAVFVDAPAQLANFRKKMDLIGQVALPRKESRDFIMAVFKDT